LHSKEQEPFTMHSVMQANIFCFLKCQASILITKDVSNTYSEQKMNNRIINLLRMEK